MQDHYGGREMRKKLRLSPPIIVLGGLVLMFVGFVVFSDRQNGTEYELANPIADDGTPESSEIEAGVGDYAGDLGSPIITTGRVDNSLQPEERAQWANDRNSYGFNEDDRAFLEEHGVTESEARALETILRENGVE